MNDLLSDIILREGGYVDRAEDAGGPTKYGITMGTLAEVRGHHVTAEDVRNLSEQEARSIYSSRYVEPYAWIVERRLLELVVDTAVNNGRGRATMWLQRACGEVEDGVIGPFTRKAVNARPERCYYRLVALRMKAYGALISRKHEQAVFCAGWMNRLAEFVRPWGAA